MSFSARATLIYRLPLALHITIWTFHQRKLSDKQRLDAEHMFNVKTRIVVKIMFTWLSKFIVCFRY